MERITFKVAPMWDSLIAPAFVPGQVDAMALLAIKFGMLQAGTRIGGARP